MIQSDVLASAKLAASGAFLNAAGQQIKRCRIKGIYAINAAAAGSVVITNGVNGPTILPLDTVAVANMGYTMIEVPGAGILCENGPAATLTGVTSVILFYA